jgi:hypothetical protein
MGRRSRTMTAPTYGSATFDNGVGPQPANAIVVKRTENTLVRYMNLETAAECYPGRFVTAGTDANDIAVNGAAGVTQGVLGYEDAPKVYRPATRATIYTVSSQVPVISGAGTIVMLYLSTDAATIVKGTPLVAAANGKVTAAGVAKFATSTAAAVLGASASPTVAGNIPSEGAILAYSMEKVTVTDTGGWIMAELAK